METGDDKYIDFESSSFRELTQSQSLIWVGQQINPDAPMYNMALRFDIYCNLDVPRFQEAFQTVVNESVVFWQCHD